MAASGRNRNYCPRTLAIPKSTHSRTDDPQRALAVVASATAKVVPKVRDRHALGCLSPVQNGLVVAGLAGEADGELICGKPEKLLRPTDTTTSTPRLAQRAPSQRSARSVRRSSALLSLRPRPRRAGYSCTLRARSEAPVSPSSLAGSLLLPPVPRRYRVRVGP